MRFDRDRWREIATSSVGAYSRRGRILLIFACGIVLVASWWGAQRFADRLLTQIPSRTGPEGPEPLTEVEIQEQIARAQELNERIRRQREIASAYRMGYVGGIEDSTTGAFSPIDWDAPDARASTAPGAGGSDAPAFDRSVPIEEPAEILVETPAHLPDLALQSGVTGTVIVRALVGPDGKVYDTAIERSIPMLNGEAQRTVRAWRFRPARSQGRAVSSWISVPVTFAR